MSSEDPSHVWNRPEQGEELMATQADVQQAQESSTFRNTHLSAIANWWSFWVIVWLGTTLAGGAFGGGIGFIVFAASGSTEGFSLLFIGIAAGAVWAGLVGMLVISTFAFIVWCFWLQKKPGVLAACAGALTGFVCAPVLFVLTSPLGAAGAYLAVKRFCRVMRAEEKNCSTPRPVISIQDLFWRMTGCALILTMWLTVIRWWWPSFLG